MLELLNAYSPAITATATVIVAAATVLYATLIRSSLKEQRREKEKPVREEMLNLIIKPLLFDVQSEIEVLRGKGLGWHHKAKVMSCGHVLEPRKSGAEGIVYENFARAYPNIPVLLNHHDTKILRLKKALKKLADILISVGFEEKCIELIAKYNQKADSHTKLPDSDICYPLSYVIDNRKELEESNLCFNFWKIHGPELLKFRERDDVREHIKKLEDMRREHLHTCEELEAELIQLMNKFRDEYGIEIAKGDTQFHGI